MDKDVFFTSDHHFDHFNVIEYAKRPFKDVNHMNERMIEIWNETVPSGSTVCYLGDFSLGKKSLHFVKRLNGKKILLSGNHDECFKQKPGKIQLYLDAGFDQVLFGNQFLYGFNCCHFPYYEDHTPTLRYTNHRPKDNGDWLLCGHIHDLWKIKNKQINVGVDVWDFKPVHHDILFGIINQEMVR